jgi:hypothetical protein
MSCFGIGINNNAPDEGNIKGTRIEIACACWFTSKGMTTPFMIKYMDENGEIQSIRNIRVNYMESKNYSGLSSLEYDCTIINQDIIMYMKLIYFKEDNKWVMVIK